MLMLWLRLLVGLDMVGFELPGIDLVDFQLLRLGLVGFELLGPELLGLGLLGRELLGRELLGLELHLVGFEQVGLVPVAHVFLFLSGDTPEDGCLQKSKQSRLLLRLRLVLFPRSCCSIFLRECAGRIRVPSM